MVSLVPFSCVGATAQHAWQGLIFLKNSRTDIVVFLDGDGSDDPYQFEKIVPPMAEGNYDLCMVAGLNIVEIPITYRRRQGGVSKVSGSIKSSILAGMTNLHCAGKRRLRDCRRTLLIENAFGVQSRKPPTELLKGQIIIKVLNLLVLDGV